MIIVQLNKDDYAYDIHSLVKAFYPSEDVSVCTVPPNTSESVQPRMFVDYEPGQIRIKLQEPENKPEPPESMLHKKSKTPREKDDTQQESITVRQEMIKTQQAAENGFWETVFAVNEKDRRETKNLLKHNIYRMLSAQTGRMLPWGTLTGIRPTKIPMTMLEEGRDTAEIAHYMSRTYAASKEKIDLSIEIAQRELEMLQRLDIDQGYSLYIGIPFCPSTCLYCSFTSFPISRWQKQTDTYLDALEREIIFTAEHFAARHLNSIYIGGGTPTTLTPEQLERLLSCLEQRLDLSHLLEFTAEAGRPDSIDREKLAVLRAHGISRISINPQTMKQETLDLIGRQHTVAQTIDSFRLARSMGFDNINMDLIMGLPEETIDDVRYTLDLVKELAPDSLTVHSLALKRAARLQMFREDYAGLKIVNTQAHLDAAADACAQMGMAPYYLYRQKNMAGNFENVGYARDGKAGLYNILIMEEVQTIIACGAGSVSKRVYPDGRIERCENVKDVSQYIGRIGEMIERKKHLLSDC